MSNCIGEDVTINMDQCRICFEEDGDLISPCNCSGSIEYMHPMCLKKWIKSSNSNKCEICNTVYDPPYDVPRPDGEQLNRALKQFKMVLLLDALVFIALDDTHLQGSVLIPVLSVLVVVNFLLALHVVKALLSEHCMQFAR